MRGLFTVFGGCLSLFIAAAAGCYSGEKTGASGETSPASAADGTQPNGGSHSSSGSDGGANGLRCEVDSLLATRCRSCHGSPLTAPMPLITYDDLAAPSKSNPAKSTAALAVERMASATAPMPPAGARVTDPEMKAFAAWVDEGLPRGTCGDGASSGSSGSGGPPRMVCTSNRTWSGSEGPNMNPGKACISCHRRAEDKLIVTVGGTLYPTLSEPDLCYGVNGGARVEITDATGTVFSMDVGPTGNFSLGSGNVVMPFTAKVIRADGKVRSMSAPQSTGDCNSCHAEKPINGAPGRILLP